MWRPVISLNFDSQIIFASSSFSVLRYTASTVQNPLPFLNKGNHPVTSSCKGHPILLRIHQLTVKSATVYNLIDCQDKNQRKRPEVYAMGTIKT